MDTNLSLPIALIRKRGWQMSIATALILLVLNLGLAAAAPTVITTIQVGNSPSGIALNPATNRAYVANSASASVTVIDTVTNSALGSPITVGTAPVAVAVNSATNRVYVANSSSDSVSVIDGTTNGVIATVAVGNGPSSVAVNETTNRIYVTNETAGTLSVINGATNTLVTNAIQIGLPAYAVAVNPTTNRIYVTVSLVGLGPSVRVVDGTNNTIVGNSIQVGSTPRSIAVNPTTNRIYVGNYSDDTLTVIDGSSNTILGSPISVGNGPYGIAVNSNNNRIYVANSLSNNLTILNGATNTAFTGSPVTVGVDPRSVAVTPSSGRLFVANMDSNTVSVLEDGTMSFATDTYAVSESGGAVSITMVRTGSSGAVNATLVITNGTATGADYTLPANLVMSWADGETGSKTLQIPIVDDTIYEGNESLTLGLTNLTGNLSLSTPVTASLIIVDNELPDTTVTLTSSPNPSTYGQSVALTATVSVVAPGTGIASGTITFTAGNLLLGTVQLNGNGVAVLNTANIPVGSNEIRAQYGGSLNFNPSLSLALIQVVNKSATNLNLTSTPNPALEANIVTFTATLTPVLPGGGIVNSGTVTFTDGATLMGTAEVNSSGVAVFTTTSLTQGNHNVTATYGGNANYSGSSASVNQQINCNPLRVTSLGEGTGCGTLRGAIAAAGAGSDKTVVLAVAGGSVINLSTGITLPIGVGLTTLPALACGANGPQVTIAANGANTGDGLTLSSGNNVYGIWVRGFSGRQIVAPSGGGNKLGCMRATKS